MSRSSSGRVVLVLLILLALVGLWVAGLAALSAGPAPTILIEPRHPAIGRRTTVHVRVSESTRGLSTVRVEFVQGERVEKLAERVHESRPAWNPWGAKTASADLSVDVGRETLPGLKGGDAIIRVTATRAGSWLRSPSPVVQEIRLPVRLVPPSLQVLSIQTYASQGGSEAVVYRVGDTTVRHGVRAGEWFFPGFPLPGGQTGECFALFGIPYDMDSATVVRLIASDEVDNTAELSFIDRFFPKPLRRDTIELSEAFMNKVVPEIVAQSPELADRGSLLDNYLQINRDLRKANNAKLAELSRSTKPEFLWRRAFQPFGNAKVMASFADRRTYRYQGRVVDTQDHLGFDLASTRADTVPAGNDGLVLFVGYLGIYGNTVILDHGFGLMTLYGHLSSMTVKEGQAVRRGDPLGKSGASGLAFGDHLHFTTLLHGLPVTPVEWWDAHWIRDRIARKLGPALPLED